jgi:hypothetical protein
MRTMRAASPATRVPTVCLCLLATLALAMSLLVPLPSPLASGADIPQVRGVCSHQY